MLDIWLIPAVVILVLIVAVLYLTIRIKGGGGVRTEGRTIHDQPFDDDNPPPG